MGIGISTFNKTVASAGTRVRLTATPTYAQAVIFEAHEANTGSLYVGNASVSTASYVKRITAGNSFSINARPNARPGPDGGMIELSQFWVDSGTAAQVVCVSYILNVGVF
jgi:hypothetical protein